MTREGPVFIRTLTERGLQVFLDLKWHDIPNTVAGAVSAARDLGVGMATVHALGGSAMMAAAAKVAGDALSLVGVTVLTSYDADGYARATGRAQVDLAAEVKRQTRAAAEAGLAGVVCSPREVRLVRGVLGEAGRIVVPGIRGATDARGDQVRVASAREAAVDGATHLVIGRPVLEAADPGAAFQRFFEEAQCVAS
jgi:orotidine-5'-phosphate decarboxylase